jgi:hypothetical protein
MIDNFNHGKAFHLTIAFGPVEAVHKGLSRRKNLSAAAKRGLKKRSGNCLGR